MTKLRLNRRFCQICHFCQICRGRLTYSIQLKNFPNILGQISPESLFSPNSPTFWDPSRQVNLFSLKIRQTLKRNFARIAIFAEFAIFAKFANFFWDPSRQPSIFCLKISSTPFPKFRYTNQFYETKICRSSQISPTLPNFSTKFR